MIYIWDNGQNYSSHAMCFFKIDAPLDEVRRLLEHEITKGGQITAAVENFNYWLGGTAKLGDYFTPNMFFQHCNNHSGHTDETIKHKIPVSESSKKEGTTVQGYNPQGFEALTPRLAQQLASDYEGVQDYTMDQRELWFAECRERGLL